MNKVRYAFILISILAVIFLIQSTHAVKISQNVHLYATSIKSDCIINSTFEFSSIRVHNDSIYINGNIFKVYASPLAKSTIYLNNYSPTLIEYDVSVGGSTSVTIENQIGGLTPNYNYIVKVDNSKIGTYTADANGVITFSYTGTPNTFYNFKIIPAPNISVSPTTWSISGNPQTGTSVNTTYTYFTIWNNGSVDATVKIAINNSADYIYCDWNTYKTTSNLNYFTCNFTTDGTTWTNIEPKSGNEPVTVIFSNLQAGTSDTFGIKLWIPRYLSNTNTQQFEIYIKAYV